ncbi:hypothetical protein E3N88_39619 [Mikania micrantha]|uniref:Uncharacterized protein n=1 Tax=Mikania micrantha TaxID=192012 RepID=A0A5N6LZY6_9ASTR|nr:hypothetical protein E3N88_39619 [Mikania micrantha]
MKQNLPLAIKKIWNLLHVMLYMLTRNISKTKLSLDLHMMIKRGKNAGKALQNLIIHHHHRSVSIFNRRVNRSPYFTFPTPINKDHEYSYIGSSPKKSIFNDSRDEIFVDPAVIKALEMLTSAAASPAVYGLGKSPMVRQLRITDSPFPLCNEEDDGYVDEAAEKYIMKFYNGLRRQG